MDDATAEEICRIALVRPQDLGKLFTCPSVVKLREYLVEQRVIGADVPPEAVRRMLRGRGIGFQHTGTWKGSPDPDFEAKQDRSLNLTTIRLLAGA